MARAACRRDAGRGGQAPGRGDLADADDDARTGRPGAADGVRLHVGQELLIHPLRRPPQRQFAQRGKVARRKVMGDRPARRVRYIDLAGVEPLDQLLRGDVHQFDGVGAVNDAVGQGFAHANAGNAGDDVVQAFDVLDVEGGVDVDAGLEQLDNVEIALGMAAAGRVGVGQFIDQRQLRPTRQQPVQIHLGQQLALVADRSARHDLDAGKQRFRFLAPMRLDDTRHHIDAFAAAGLRLQQHLECLADTRRGAEEDLQPAAPLPVSGDQQRLGRGPLVANGFGASHRASDQRC